MAEKEKIIDDETFGKILATILGDFDDTKEIIPEYQIRGRGARWFLDPEKRKMVYIKGGTKCYLLKKNYNNEKRFLLYTVTNHVIVIDREDVIYIGYN
tara:strand:- start:360 stop:653 length:294 start_codon:yes stop_codon:yes gene_type:complete